MAKQNMRDACAKDILEFKCFGGPEKWLMKKLVIADHMKQKIHHKMKWYAGHKFWKCWGLTCGVKEE